MSSHGPFFAQRAAAGRSSGRTRACCTPSCCSGPASCAPPAKLLASVHEDIVRTGNEVNHPYCLFDLSLLECAAGNAALAADLAREGVEAARDTADTWGETVLLYPLALANAWLGRAEPARAAAERRLDEASWRGERPGIVRAHSVLGLLALSEGNAGSASRLLAEAAELLEEMGFANPGAFPILPDAVEALAAGGDLTMAEALLERLDLQAASGDNAWAAAAADRARGALLLARGEADAAAEGLEAAAASFDRMGYAADGARAVLLHGQALLRRGQRTVAAEVLADARARFAGMGAALWEARAAENLERASPGRAAGGLTDAESRIAALVANGMKNKEIGQALFMSVATVEAHLTRIYRKLGIRSRSELARRVADRSVQASDGETG